MFYLVRHTQKISEGSLQCKEKMENFFDSGLTAHGKLQAYKIGEKILEEVGFEKKIVVITSPYLRCLQTGESLMIGMKKSGKKNFSNTMFVEDGLREINNKRCVGDKNGFKNIHFFQKNKLVAKEIIYNKIKSFEKIHFDNVFPESKEMKEKRFIDLLDCVKEYIKSNENVVPILVTHGFFIRNSSVVFKGENFKYYHYGAVNKFKIEKDKVDMEYFNKKLH